MPDDASPTAPPSPTLWRRVQDAFGEVAELPRAERAAALDRLCRDAGGAPDAALRAEVERLLRLDAEAEGFFDSLGSAAGQVATGGGALPPPERDALVGQRAGAYRIEARIGAGGMGAVYRASRADGLFERTVALKVTRPGLAPALASRFRRERRLLAALDDPAIARLLDAGQLADGRPWIAMEYVEGEPLTAAADRLELGVEDRLRLFVRVCEAVGHAHRALVVHRDLKPSNILVTGDPGARAEPGPEPGALDPRIKLLDFGIAALLDGGDDAQSAGRLLTPAYAAPEQAARGPITTATDVYALGVLLHELLVGRRPSRPADGAGPEAPSAALARTPEAAAGALAAARATSAGHLRRRLRGDLDAVVARALQARPEDRYGSADALARDVARHLDGRPVDAHAGGVGYRAGRFVRRHRVGVAAAALALAAVLGGAAVAVWQAAVAARERDRAVATTALFLDALGDVDPERAGARALSAEDLLDRTAERLRTGLRRDPQTRAAAEAAIGKVYGSLGVFDRAERLQRDALALRERALGRTHPDVLQSRADLAMLLTRDSRYDEAASLLVPALRDGERRLGPAHPAVASVRHAMGINLTNEGRFAEAEPLLRRALADRAAVLGPADPAVAQSYAALGALTRRQGRLAEAEREYRRAAARYRALYGTGHVRYGHVLNQLGVVLKNGGDYGGAEPYYRDALAIFRRAYGEQHPETALALGNLGLLLKDRGRLADSPSRAAALYAEAEPLVRQSLAIYRALHGDDHLRTAHTEAHLGMLALARGQARDAEALFRRSLRHHDAARTPPMHSARPYPMTGLGEALVAQGRAAEAEPTLREALAIREASTPGHWRIAEAQSALAACLAALGRADAARELLDAVDARVAEGGGEFDVLARVAAARRRALEPQASG